MRDKMYFLTDAHLGSGEDSLSRELELVAFLDSIKEECSVLVLLGDMFDFWFSYKHVVPRGSVRFLGKLAELADAGVKIHYFIGNHDMWIFNYLQEQFPVEMHSDPEILRFDGRLFYVGHGDGMGNQDANYNFLKMLFRSAFCQKLFAFVHPWVGFTIARKWSESSRKSHSVKYQKFLGDDKEAIVQHCKSLVSKRPEIEFCVFGHRHTPVTRPLLEHSVYVNVGDWISHRNYAVYDDGKLVLHDLNLEN